MPLSEHEQRVFDEIERSLADDPKFASAVRAQDPRHRGRRRMIVGGLISVVGLVGMVLGVMQNSLLIGAIGAVVAFVGVLVALHIQRKGSGELKAVDGKARRRTGGKSPKRHPGGGSSLGDRLEERWRRRRDNGWQ